MREIPRPRDGWRLLDHTADIRLEVRGPTLEKLFVNAAKGLSTVLDVVTEPNSEEQIEVTLEGGELDELLVNWLREILYYSQALGLVVVDVEMVELSDNILQARLTAKKRPIGTEPRTEIKGVTYHAMSIKRNKDCYTVKIIFDV